MVWEEHRYNWSRLRAQGTATGVPQAMAALQAASSQEEADRAYWQIDNTVVVQGALYEAAVPTARCLVTILPRCTAVARPQILELLGQLAMGKPDPSEVELGNGDLQSCCIVEISRGVAIYFDLLENGSDDERALCVDLLHMCCREDGSLRPRTKWYFEKLLSEGIGSGLRALINNCLMDMGAVDPVADTGGGNFCVPRP